MNHNPSDRMHNPCPNFEQLEANRPHLCVGQLAISKAFPAKCIHQDICGARQQNPKLISAKGRLPLGMAYAITAGDKIMTTGSVSK
jgi:hypothetical protein